MNKGTLYIVGGPIGNLSDITHRAVDILKNVDVVLSEDTRETNKLLNRYKIKAKQISYRDQNHDKVFPKILDILEKGKSLALISDSGTPLISDPGFKLVRDIHKLGHKVSPIPGPSSLVAALSACGLPTDKFVFLGFLPKKSNQREKILLKYGKLDSTLIIFESPHRIRRLLKEIKNTLGNRQICIAREMTKIYEEMINCNIDDIIGRLNLITTKGEIVVLVAKENFNERSNT